MTNYDPKTQYQCARCGRVYNLSCDESWNDEKAKAELKKTFGDIPLSECCMVCDDCYKLIMN